LKKILAHFKNEKESDYFRDHAELASKIQVAGHELFGHGSGRLIYKNESGMCPFSFVDPLTNEPYTSCYEKGETYSQLFGHISDSMEECKADLAGFYLLS
jgi:dipeptidyl-peptidase-3